MEYSKKIEKKIQYGIFQEYSKKNCTQQKYVKIWNMEYSIEYSWNIQKKWVTRRGGVKFNHAKFSVFLCEFRFRGCWARLVGGKYLRILQ